MSKPCTWQEFQRREREARRKWLATVFEQSESVAECADAVGVSACNLYHMSKTLGVPHPKKDPSRKYRRCAKAGMTQAETARSLGVSTWTVSWAARKFKIKFKPGRPGVPKGTHPKKGKTTIKQTRPIDAIVTGKTMADYAREENARMKRMAAE